MNLTFPIAAALICTILFPAFTGCGSARKGRFEKRFAESFSNLDTDENGSLSYQEYLESRVADKADDPEAKFAELDTNQDGSLSESELRTAVESRFGR